MNINRQINLVVDLQHELPNCMLGGSLALYIYGFNLGRDLFDSDLDLSIDDEFSSVSIKHLVTYTKDEKKSADMQFQFETDNGIKVDFRIDESMPKPIIVVHNQKVIKLAPLDYILKYKLKYANSGHEKHINDLTAMGLADLVKRTIQF